MYPLKFEPILKQTLWGGDKIISFKQLNDTRTEVGESWEISAVEGSESIVAEGPDKGMTLTEVLSKYREELLGEANYARFGVKFPLLVKFIDARQDLSIQVHPGDEVAAERHNSFGKTEMWYVVDADENAELIIGFSKDCSRDEYMDALDDNKVEELLQHVPVKKGDVFFIPAGLVHAIGKGVVVAEIQQSSDVTYRIYDYKRVDDNGNERELHTEQALDVINFDASENPKTAYQVIPNDITPLVSCDYFTTNLIQFDTALIRNYGHLDSFIAYMCLEGSFIIEANDEKTVVNKGDTVLIPASIDEIGLTPHDKVTLLEVHV